MFEKKQVEAPPAYVEYGGGGSSSSRLITANSHHFSLSTSSGPYYPGDTIRLVIAAPRDALKDVVQPAELVLEGISHVQLMGKSRYQAGQMINSGGGGITMPITARDTHTFASTSSTIDLVENKGHDGKDQLQWEVDIVVPTERSCGCGAQGDMESHLLPSIPESRTLESSDVLWRVRMDVKRKGLLKRNVSVTLPITVDIPNPPQQFPLSIQGEAPLAMESNTLPPALLAHLAIPNPTEPLRIPFSFELQITPQPSILSKEDIYPQGKLVPSITLSRSAWTKGLDQKNFDEKEGTYWAGERVAMVSSRVKGPGVLELVDSREGRLRFDGYIDYLEVNKSCEGCALHIKYALNLHVQWDKLAKHPFTLRVPVILPLQSGNDNPKG